MANCREYVKIRGKCIWRLAEKMLSYWYVIYVSGGLHLFSYVINASGELRTENVFSYGITVFGGLQRICLVMR